MARRPRYEADIALCQTDFDQACLRELLELDSEGDGGSSNVFWPPGLSPLVAKKMLSLVQPAGAGTRELKAMDVLRELEPFVTCPLTKVIFRDPVVVLEDQQTYERMAIEWLVIRGPDRDNGRTSPISPPFSKAPDMVPNHLVRHLARAYELLRTLNAAAEPPPLAVLGGGNGGAASSAAQPGPDDGVEATVDAFECPLTHQPMREPLITPDGHTYDGAAIRLAVARFGVDPLTKRPLHEEDLRPNRALADAQEQLRRRIPAIVRLAEQLITCAPRRRPMASPMTAGQGKRARCLREVHTI